MSYWFLSVFVLCFPIPRRFGETAGKHLAYFSHLFPPISTDFHFRSFFSLSPKTFTPAGIAPIYATFPLFRVWSWREMNQILGTVVFMGLASYSLTFIYYLGETFGICFSVYARWQKH
jgi:hypothetical protein